MSSTVTFHLHSDYGYVILVVVAGFFVLNYLSMKVLSARKKYGVKYPTMYSDTSEMFNCYQRAHQNALESYTLFLAFLLIGGLQFPRMCAICGLIYLAGRLVYAHGYYSGDPQKRVRGSFAYVGLLGLLISTVVFALNLLGVL